jgi:Acetyltransferase (GNAT) domain
MAFMNIWAGRPAPGPARTPAEPVRLGRRDLIRRRPARMPCDGGGGIAFCGGPGQTMAMTWLPDGFAHPIRVPVGDDYHLRPITAADAELDYPAVMGSQPRLWSLFGPAWGWPAASMTYEQDAEDLARHEVEIAAHQSFNYALFDEAETALLGCVYIDPPEKQGADAEISWWVVDAQVGTGLQRAVDALVPAWIAADWPFTQPRYIGRDLSWADWLALPDV